MKKTLLYSIAVLMAFAYTANAQTTTFSSKKRQPLPVPQGWVPNIKGTTNTIQKINGATASRNNANFTTQSWQTDNVKTAVQQLTVQHPNLRLQLSDDNSTPIFVHDLPLFKTSSPQTDPARIALDFLATYKDLFQITDPSAEFHLRRATTDEQGKTHLRFDQYFQNIPVWASDVVIHLNEHNEVETFTGRYHPTPTLLETTPSITPEAARQRVADDLHTSPYPLQLTEATRNMLHFEESAPRLVIFPSGENRFSLAWHVTFFENFIQRWEYFVDAHTGNILHRYSGTCTDGAFTANATDLNGQTQTINTYKVGNTYYMLDASRAMFNSTQSNLPDDPVGGILTLNLGNNPLNQNSDINHITSSNNSWNNPNAVSAHNNAGLAYKYFKDTHARNSLNGQGGSIFSLINVSEDDGSSMGNAFWNGYVMAYGSGDAAFKSLAGGLDVAGHEMSHGVTQNEANLIYQFQPGALNESFSDIFGAMIDRNDWKIGEDVVKPAYFPSGALRDMQNPHNGASSIDDPSWQPASMSEYQSLTINQDNGGVHINSGIPNKAYYLFATSVGKDKAERIFYKALKDFLTQSSKFVDCRIAVVQAAQQLYGTTEANAARDAFGAVGIYANDGGGTNTTPTTTTQNDLPPVQGVEHFMAHSTYGDDNGIYDYNFDTDQLTALTTIKAIRKPSIDDSGSLASFVAQNNNIYDLNLTTTPASPSPLTNDGEWLNVATSRDGSKIAAISIYDDRSIFVYDFNTGGSWHQFELYNPTTSQGSATGGAPEYADQLEFDYSGEYIIYDAYNTLNNPNGQDIDYWDVGVIRVWNKASNTWGDGKVFKIYSSLPEGVSIGNPTFAKNSSYIIAYDYINAYQNTQAVKAANIETGVTADVYSNNNALGYPTYSPQDDAIAFTRVINGDTTIVARALNSDKITGTGNLTTFFTEAKWPNWYNRGQRTFQTPVANFTANIQTGNDPLSVSFIDQSQNSPQQWSWAFQGGTPATSTERNPLVQYNTQGSYKVTLTATNPAGSDTEVKNGFIQVWATPTEQTAQPDSYLLLYPNPTQGVFHLKLELPQIAQNIEIGIYNLLGQLVGSYNYKQTSQVEEITKLTNQGLYIIQVNIDGVIRSEKIIVQ